MNKKSIVAILPILIIGALILAACNFPGVGNGGTTELPAGGPWTLYAKDGRSWNVVKTGITTEAVVRYGAVQGWYRRESRSLLASEAL